ncbi:unnamed protein product [Heterosigma akashiwo]
MADSSVENIPMHSSGFTDSPSSHLPLNDFEPALGKSGAILKPSYLKPELSDTVSVSATGYYFDSFSDSILPSFSSALPGRGTVISPRAAAFLSSTPLKTSSGAPRSSNSAPPSPSSSVLNQQDEDAGNVGSLAELYDNFYEELARSAGPYIAAGLVIVGFLQTLIDFLADKK